MKKRFLSCILMICMVSTVLAVPMFTANAATSGIYRYEVSDGKARITDCDDSVSGSITIPSTLGGYPVTSIDASAFWGCSSLTNIAIPNSVTSIGFCAFMGCSSLTNITIPNSVTHIGISAFEECSSLTSITIPNRDYDTIGLNQ